MVTAEDSSPFVQEVHALADHVGPLPDAKAQAFLQAYPMDAIFRELSAPHITPGTVATARVALDKVLTTSYGSALLPQLVPYASAALQSPATAPTLRQLAVQQLERLLVQLAAGAQQAGPQQQQQLQELISLLLAALRDEDVGVAAAAEHALIQLGAAGRAALDALIHMVPAAHELAALAASQDPVVSIRALTLVLRLAGASPEAGAAMRGVGLLEPLQAQLRDPSDVLSCVAALQLVKEAAEGCDAEGMAAALQDAVGPQLGALLQPGQDVALQCASLQAGAALLSTALQAGRGPMTIDGAAALAAADPLLASLKRFLDVGSSEELPQEVEEAALDAVGTIGLQAAGAAAILLDSSRLFWDVAYNAFGRAPNPAIRICALHAVAAVAGAERAAGARGRAEALLGPDAEDALRAAVFEGALASRPTATPADVALELLSQPFLELRVACYRALSALCTRDWAAAAVCTQQELLAFLLNPQSETGRQGCEWRYACVRALGGTVREAAGGVGPCATVLAAAAQRVEAAVAQGPYGAQRTAPEQFQVATMSRGGGGV